jgi:4'-phosphopantetheinyl transferase
MEKEFILYPIILAVPKDARQLPPRDRVLFLSLHARKALKISAIKSHLELNKPLKDADGRPLPSNGIYWSLTHKPEYVAAVVARTPIGIDIEKIAERQTASLYDKVADSAEWSLIGGKSWQGFHRYWTAKEAVLKADGTGLSGLSHCRVIAIIDEVNLIIQMRERTMTVEHHYFNNHIASIVKTDEKVSWTVLKSFNGTD